MPNPAKIIGNSCQYAVYDALFKVWMCRENDFMSFGKICKLDCPTDEVTRNSCARKYATEQVNRRTRLGKTGGHEKIV